MEQLAHRRERALFGTWESDRVCDPVHERDVAAFVAQIARLFQKASDPLSAFTTGPSIIIAICGVRIRPLLRRRRPD